MYNFYRIKITMHMGVLMVYSLQTEKGFKYENRYVFSLTKRKTRSCSSTSSNNSVLSIEILIKPIKGTDMRFILYTILVILLTFITSTYAQHYGSKFIIAPNNYTTDDYSIDGIAQQVYFDLYGSWKIKVDLKTGAVDSTQHVGTVTFGNKRHLMFDLDTLYNLDTGSYYALIPPDTIYNSYWHFYPYFSPNDNNLMFTAYYPQPYPSREIINNFIFSLKDSSFIPVDSAVWSYSNYSGYGNAPQWSSDSSFVYAAGDSAIAEYFIRSRRIDTLVSLHNYNRLVSFAYNTKYNFLAYSTSHGYIIPNISPLIYFHYKDSTSDFLAFSPVRDDSSCKSFGIALTYLC